MWPFKKISAEHALKELVESSSAVLHEHLVNVIVFGSKVSGEFREGRSNVNVLLLVNSVSIDILRRLKTPLESWAKVGHGAPIFLGQSELQRYANSLPIEFLDMQDHHKIIFGSSDPLLTLTVDRTHLRAQCVQELSVKLLKLRQAFILTQEKPEKLRGLLEQTLPSILTLFRAAWRLEGELPKGSKMDAARELARRAGFDDEVLQRLWDLHIRREADDLSDLAWRYIEGVSRVLSYVSQR